MCCAYALAKRGVDVTVCDGRGIGNGASFGNAGAVAPGHPPLNKPGRIRSALGTLFDPHSPLFIAPRWTPGLVSWLWRFHRAGNEYQFNRAMNILALMGRRTSELFDSWIDAENIDCHYRTEGFYEVFMTPAGLKEAEHEADIVRGVGYLPRVLDGDQLRELEPHLADSVIGGVHFPESASLRPYQFVCELAERAKQHGVRFVDSDIVSITQIPEEAVCSTADGNELPTDFVVVAAGAHSTNLLKPYDVHFPLQAAKGYHRDYQVGSGFFPDLSITCVFGERSVFCTPMDGFVRLAGTLEFSGVNEVMRPTRLEQLTKAAQKYLKPFGESEPISEWCGLRPCLPDGLPAVGPLNRAPNVFVATGHAMLGMTLGPVTGALISEWILDEKPSIDIGLLDPNRF